MNDAPRNHVKLALLGTANRVIGDFERLYVLTCKCQVLKRSQKGQF